MARRDTHRTMKRSLSKQEQSLDMMPHKSTKKAKAKERQEGRKIIATEVIELSKEDFERFTDALANPPEPNEALKAAFKRYGKSQKKKN